MYSGLELPYEVPKPENDSYNHRPIISPRSVYGEN